ncbi:MAG: DNA sulfur modification protein DndB [Planctomycetota bacterium]|nr:DNA sulfur modification protein DndB [Planctomycetota bacterium]
MNRPEFNIPAVRGTQAGRAFYTAMCPIRLLSKLFPVGVDQTTSHSHQSFRKVNLARVREIAKDVVAHHDDYHLASVTVSVEQQVRFIAAENARPKQVAVGELLIPLEARMTIVDGVHRILGLQRALKEFPSLADECIAMLIHVDPDGTRRGQIFSDVKRHERSSAQSRRIAVDDRDEIARLTREVIAVVPVFVDAIEMEKTAISNRSRKLFTLSALYHANKVLLADRKDTSYEDRLALATEFWTEVATKFPDWTEIVKGETSAAEIRANYVHCHAIGIAAIARAGRALLAQSPKGWKRRLAKLSSLNWARSNTKLWEGRAMIGGRLSKSSSAVARAGNAVKLHLGLKLTNDEQALEK